MSGVLPRRMSRGRATVRRRTLGRILVDVAKHAAWGPYLAARSRRVLSLAADIAAAPVLPEWTQKYDDVLTQDPRRELAVWRASAGVPAYDRSWAEPVPSDDREAAYHRNLTSRINARYGEALKVWVDRIIHYVGKSDEQTGRAREVPRPARPQGVATPSACSTSPPRKPLPVDHQTRRTPLRRQGPRHAGRRRPARPIEPFPRHLQQQSEPSLGL